MPITPCTNSGTNDDRPEHRHPDQPHRERRSRPPSRSRRRSNGRIGSRHPPLDHANTASSAAAATSAPTHLAGRPRVLAGRPRRARAAAARCRRRAARAEPVDRVLGRFSVRRGIVSADHEQGEASDGQVDVEDPAPGRVVDDEPADERTDDRRGGERGADQPLVAAAVARRDDLADRREREREEPAGADPLDGAEDDELAACSAPGRRAPSRRGRARSRSGTAAGGRGCRRASRTAARSRWRRACRR